MTKTSRKSTNREAAPGRLPNQRPDIRAMAGGTASSQNPKAGRNVEGPEGCRATVPSSDEAESPPRRGGAPTSKQTEPSRRGGAPTLGSGQGRSSILQDLIQRANNRDSDALEELRRVLDANPEFWRTAGDLGNMLIVDLIRRISQGSPSVVEMLSRKVAEMRKELAGSETTPLVVMAVDRVVVSWLHVQELELFPPPKGNEPTPHQTWWLKQHREADRRHLAAVRMLARLQGRRASKLAASSGSSEAACTT